MSAELVAILVATIVNVGAIIATAGNMRDRITRLEEQVKRIQADMGEYRREVDVVRGLAVASMGGGRGAGGDSS